MVGLAWPQALSSRKTTATGQNTDSPVREVDTFRIKKCNIFFCNMIKLSVRRGPVYGRPRVLDSKPRDRWFEPQDLRRCVVFSGKTRLSLLSTG